MRYLPKFQVSRQIFERQINPIDLKLLRRLTGWYR